MVVSYLWLLIKINYNEKHEKLGFPVLHFENSVPQVAACYQMEPLPPCRKLSPATESAPEGAAVKRGWERHDGVCHRQEAEEEHQQQQAQVEVVGSGGFKHTLVGNIAAHHCPALEVHGSQQAQDVDAHQSWGVEGAHPERRDRTPG